MQTDKTALFHGKNSILMAFLLSFVIVSCLFFSTLESMVDIWIRSETYNHCFFVIPGFVYLLFFRKNDQHYPIQPDWRFAIPLLPIGFFWLISGVSSILVFEQFAFVLMVVLGVVVICGWRLTKIALFPLFFLFLMVPAGDQLTPVMIDFTADFAVTGLRLLGIPVFREGTYFSLPTGHWSVVEACSGVRYLIASVTIGLLFAYINYVVWWKRLLFLAMSAIVPIFANGIRAILIVLLGHFSDMQLATGADHLVYGWFFFGVVMFLLFWIGSFWRDSIDETDQVGTSAVDSSPDNLNKPEMSPHSASKQAAKHPVSYRQFIVCTLLFALVLSIWPVWHGHIYRFESVNVKAGISQSVNSLTLCEQCVIEYEPQFKNADLTLNRKVLWGQNRVQVGIYATTYYSWKGDGELISSVNRTIAQDNNNSYLSGRRIVTWEDGIVAEELIIGGKKNYLAYNFRTIGGEFIKSDLEGKLKEIVLRLQGKNHISQFVSVAAAFQLSPDEVRSDLELLALQLAKTPTSIAYSQ